MTETTSTPNTRIPGGELTDEQRAELTRSDAENAVLLRNQFAYSLCLMIAMEFQNTFKQAEIDKYRRNLEVSAAQEIAVLKTEAVSLNKTFNERVEKRKLEAKTSKMVIDIINRFDASTRTLNSEISRFFDLKDESKAFLYTSLTEKGMFLMDELLMSKDSGKLVIMARLFNAGHFDSIIDAALSAEGIMPEKPKEEGAAIIGLDGQPLKSE